MSAAYPTDAEIEAESRRAYETRFAFQGVDRIPWDALTEDGREAWRSWARAAPGLARIVANAMEFVGPGVREILR